MLYPRLLRPKLEAACKDTPVVLVNGARQTGKTTLVRDALSSQIPYITFDDASTRATATADPAGFINNLPESIVLDEVQFCPGLFPAIKVSVDNNRKPGRFVLTGSANVLLLPRISESLAGRMEILTLWPLSLSELNLNSSPGILDSLFDSAMPIQTLPETPREELIRRILTGGYPEPVQRSDDDRRHSWFASYVTSILQSDIRELSEIEGIHTLPTMLGILAGHSANLLNVSELSRMLELPYVSVHRYLALLEATFLVGRLPAWSGNLGMRFAKTPKILMADTGLACHLLGLDATRLQKDGPLLGRLLENWVAMELKKQANWSRTSPTLHHWRAQNRNEVDIVLESRSGDVVGIEVKTSATVGPADFNGLRAFQSVTGDRFRRGIVFYSGGTVLPFGERLVAVPLSALGSSLS